jgi:hypothetical protein
VFEITRENGRLVARGTGDTAALGEAVSAFVSAEIAAMLPWLSAEAVREAGLAGKRLTWHPNYDRPAWPDTDPPLEIVDAWKTDMLRKNTVVFYRCQRPDCRRCRNPEAPWSFHLKTIRPDGLDATGAGAEVEVRRGKRRETEIVLVDQPVFALCL